MTNTGNILARSQGQCHIVYHPKGPSYGCLISLSNESSKVSFSHAHLVHVGHKELANFFFVARIFGLGSATVGMYTSGRGPKKVHLSASIDNLREEDKDRCPKVSSLRRFDCIIQSCAVFTIKHPLILNKYHI